MIALNTPAYVRVRDAIRADIAASVFAPGAPLRLGALTERYGLSANPIREALLHLEGEGLVTMHSHRGAQVTCVDADFVSQVYDLRGALQAMLGRRAAARATRGELAAIREAEASFAEAALAGDAASAVAANRLFHQRIDQAGNSPMAMTVLAGRSALIYAVRSGFGYGAGRLREVVAQHAAIADAIASLDGDAAASLLVAHSEDAKQDLLALLFAQENHKRNEETS